MTVYDIYAEPFFRLAAQSEDGPLWYDQAYDPVEYRPCPECWLTARLPCVDDGHDQHDWHCYDAILTRPGDYFCPHGGAA